MPRKARKKANSQTYHAIQGEREPSPVSNYRNGIKKSVSGKKTLYYTWDDLHNEIEVFDDLGKHIGVLDPKTGKFIKKAVKGRKIKL